MKIIHCNGIKIEQLKKCKKTTPKEAISSFIKSEEKNIQYVCSENENENEGDFLACHFHPFVEAVHLAYSDHLPLAISPDMIWYLITSGVSIHINKNAEHLRHTFVNHEGKEKIEIRPNWLIAKLLK